MNDQHNHALRQMLAQQDVAALGTLHEGTPFVSMVPYALLPDSAEFVIHVSQLATHTRDMLDHPAVGLMVSAPRAPALPAQALARLSIQGQARQLVADDDRYAAARQAYLARFPDSEPMFGFADFSLFVIAPTTLRFVGGFAQARSLSGDGFRRIMRGETG